MDSVAAQSGDIEHIIIDGLSTDQTVSIAKTYPHVAFISSEKDAGIYDALNKGLAVATGDIIGFLHSDDVFYDSDILNKVHHYFEEDDTMDALYGDIEFVNADGKRTRYYSSKGFTVSDFSKGMMPAHTSFFAKKKIYDAFQFKLGYQIAADFDHLLRVFLSDQFTIRYLPILTTSMLIGGVSTKNIRSRITLNKEILKSCKENGVRTNLVKIYSKYFKKIMELNP